MIEYLIEKSEQVKELEAWDRFLEMALDGESKEYIHRLGICSVVRELRAQRRFVITPAVITPTEGQFDLVTGGKTK